MKLKIIYWKWWINWTIHLRNNKYGDALELVNWLIDFIVSISKSEEVLLDMVFALTFIKAACEKILGLGYEEEYDFLKENGQRVLGYRHFKGGLRFFSQQDVTFATGTGEIKKDLLYEIEFLKNDKWAYPKVMELYKDIFEES